MKHLPVFIFLCLFIVLPIRGSYFRNYQVEKGLSNNSVWAIVQDSEGFMWFGTKDGLNRFDGKNFKVYRKHKDDPNSIGHSFIHCIKKDSKNRLLIGTRNGVYLYNREKDNFHPIILEADSTKEVNVNDILEDKDGKYWIACHGGGIYRLSSDLIVEKHYVYNEKNSSIPIDFVWTIVSDNYGNLWLGTAGKGLVHFDKKNEKFTQITNREGLSTDNQSIFSIYCDEDNSLWIGTYTKGLFKYNYIDGKVSHYLENTGSVKAITKYSDHELIMGSEKGLIIFNKNTEEYEIIDESGSIYDNTTDNSIFSIARDSEGAFWIGTYFSGVNYFSPSTNKFLYFNSLSKKVSQKYIISSMTEGLDGSILIATHNNNIIYKYTPSNKQTEEFFKMDYRNIQCIFRDGDNLYVSSHGRGISVLSLSKKKIVENIKLNTIEGKSILKVSNGNIIFSLEEGGCAYRKPNGEIKRINKLSKIPIVAIAEAPNGYFWFVTHAYGLFSLSPTEIWDESSPQANSNKYITNNNLTSIYCDKGNRLWIGTKDEGLILFNSKENKIERTITEANGLLSNTIYSILSDKNGYIWATTSKGVVRIDGNTLDIKPFAYIGKDIQYNSFCALKSSDNNLFWGGTDGFITLNPDELVSNEKMPQVVLTSFRISNKEVSPGEDSSPLKKSLESTTEIILNYDESNFSFDFASLSYIFPEKNQYAYMLEGFDKDWNYVTDNTAQYMNIPPGKYVFKVKGANNDGLWNDEATHIIIKIKPPFWFEYYMIILYILLAIGFIVCLIRQYSKYIGKKNQEKQYKFQVIKEREMYESKINFFTNIAHEIRTPLSLITAPLENIIRENSGSERTQKNLHTIERNTNRLLDLVNQLLDFRKIENDMFLLNIRYQDIIKTIKKVYDQYYQDVKILKIEMELDLPEDKILGFVDSEALYKIISNLISNAMRFTLDKIVVKVESTNDKLFLSVTDNGKGIDEHYLDKIFEPFYQIQISENENYTNQGSGLGLSLSQSLAQKLGGKISVQSEYQRGSTFILELPIIKNEAIADEQDNDKSENISEAETLEPELMYPDGQTILIVEDNAELRSFMIECLAENYNVLEAENGVDALQVLEYNVVDIIISDILMPKMNGLELCNNVKSNPAYSHLPFILLSAKTDTLTKIDGLKKGADVYMEKPFSTEQLKAQLNSIIENRINLQKKLVKSPLQYVKRSTDDNDSVDFVNKLNAFILENMSDENFSIDNLSSEFAISRTNFQKKIKTITGLTPNEYIKLIRLNKSAELLSTGKYRINEVCIIVGFNTPSYFSKCFFEHFGKLPKDFIQNK